MWSIVGFCSEPLVRSWWFFFFSSRRRHTRWTGDWSSDVCSSDLDQRGLAGVGEADQAHVGQESQLELDALLLALGPRLREARRLQRRCREVHVPQAAPPTLGEHPAPAGLAQVGEHLAARGVLHDGYRRHREEQLGRGVAVLVPAAPGLAVAGPVLALEAEVEQRGEPLVRFQDDVAAVPAVAPGGPSPRRVLLPPERHRARPAVACLDEDLGFVDELHGQTSRGRIRTRCAFFRVEVSETSRFGARLPRHHVHVRAVVRLLLVLHLARNPRVDGEVAAHADAAAGVHAGTHLPDEDVARNDALAAVHLHTAVLPRRVAPVAGRPLPLLVCHCLRILLSQCGDARDPGDLQLGVGLAVAADAVPALFLGAEVPQLAVLAVREDLGLDLGAADRRGPDLDALALADGQHLERYRRAHRLLQLLHLEQVALLDAVLLPARADHCVHRTAPWLFRLFNQPGWQGNPAARRGKERGI